MVNDQTTGATPDSSSLGGNSPLHPDAGLPDTATPQKPATSAIPVQPPQPGNNPLVGLEKELEALPKTFSPKAIAAAEAPTDEEQATSAAAKALEDAVSASEAPAKPASSVPPTAKPPAQKTALDSLSGSLQSGGGKSILSEEKVVPKPSAPKVLGVNEAKSGKNPELMEELRKQSSDKSSLVRPLRTFKDDISSVIEKRKTSFVSVVAAEADRRAKKIEATTQKQPLPTVSWGRYVAIGGAALIAILGIGILAYAFLFRQQEIGTVQIQEVPKLVFSESQEAINITKTTPRSLVVSLDQKRLTENLRLGSILQLYPTKQSVGADGNFKTVYATSQDFLKALDIVPPPLISRVLDPEMMLGLHAFNGNQYFLIFKTADYERGFAGMLEWERTLAADVFVPLGVRELKPAPAPPALIATTTQATPTSTPTTTIIEVTGATTEDFKARPFVDVVIKNKEARALLRDDGSIALIYGFPDKNTIIITTNEYTFTEIVTRMQSIRI